MLANGCRYGKRCSRPSGWVRCIIPATTLLERAELRDRLERGNAKAVVTTAQLAGTVRGPGGRARAHRRWRCWRRLACPYADPHAASEDFRGDRQTRADDLLFLYFTSGTTARPKLVAHTQVSYPVGHLSTMYWLGLRPGDVHLNLSSPGGPNMRGRLSSRPGTRRRAC